MSSRISTIRFREQSGGWTISAIEVADESLTNTITNGILDAVDVGPQRANQAAGGQAATPDHGCERLLDRQMFFGADWERRCEHFRTPCFPSAKRCKRPHNQPHKPTQTTNPQETKRTTHTTATNNHIISSKRFDTGHEQQIKRWNKGGDHKARQIS